MPDSQPPRVFVSYSRTDGLAFARRLHLWLEAEGLSLYRDLNNLQGGEDWWRQIESAIRSVEHVVLVLTPAALQSPYVTREWKLARQEGRRVSPISGSSLLDFSHLPRWMSRAHRYDIDIPESRARLVQVLKGAAKEKRVPFMAGTLPESFVARPAQFAELKRGLLDSRGEPVAITAALRGAGGYGKTVLADALCYDGEIQDAFSDGILRVTLGEKPENMVGRIADVVEILTGSRPGFQSVDAAKIALVDALDDRRCLLVIDDVWRAHDLSPLLHRGPRDQTTRLVTTRDDRVLPHDAIRIAVDAMKPSEAQELLLRGIPALEAVALRTRLTTLATRLGEWPLLLSIANGVMRARMRGRASATNALAYVERAISERGIGKAFRSDDRDCRRRTAWDTLQISLEQLDLDERSRFGELAVFVEDAEIPVAVAIGLWNRTAGLSALNSEELLTRLDELSLLIELDLARGVLRLHDVVRTMLRENLGDGRIAELEHLLVAHFEERSGGNLAEVTDVYGLRHLLVHLNGAGEVEAACSLLRDPRWLLNKLKHLGIQSLLSDYGRLWHRDFVVDLIGRALALAAPALASDPRELAPQLLARLAPSDAVGLDEFLTRVSEVVLRPAFVPARPTLTAPGAELRRFEGHRNQITGVTVLGDGRRALSAADDSTMRLWDLETGVELGRFVGHKADVDCTAVFADERRVLSGSGDRTLRLWDLETGAELRRLDVHQWVRSVALLGNGARALLGCGDGTLRLWDLETSNEVRCFQEHESAISSVTVLEDGRRALAGSDGGTLRLLDLETGTALLEFEPTGPVTSVAVFGDGRRALSGSLNRGGLQVWDLETGVELRRFEDQARVNGVAVLGDGRRVLSGSDDRSVRLCDVETGAELRRFEGHEDRVTAVAVVGDGRRALSGSRDFTLRLWDLEANAERRFEAHEAAVNCVTVIGGGRRALSGSDDWTLRLWDLDTGGELRRFEGHEGSVSDVTVLGDGRRAFSVSGDSWRLWDIESGVELRRSEGPPVELMCVTGVGDSRALSGSSYGTLQLWDLETGAELRRFHGPEAPVRFEACINSVTVLGDGRRVLTASDVLRLRDLESGLELRRFEGHQHAVISAAVLCDGRRALSGSVTGMLQIWDLDTGAELQRLEGHEREVSAVVMLSEGRRVLSGSRDKTLRLWDLATSAEIARLTFDAAVTAFSWSHDYGRLVVGDSRGSVHLVKLVE